MNLGTIGKRFVQINLDNTETNRQRYRELLFTTVDLEKYISGVIMFEETFYQVIFKQYFYYYFLINHKTVTILSVLLEQIFRCFASVNWHFSFQKTNSKVRFVDILKDKGIKVGIKLDRGLTAFGTLNEQISQGKTSHLQLRK